MFCEIMYESGGLVSKYASDEVEGAYESPKLAKSDFDNLRKQFPNTQFSVWRDGVKLSDDRLCQDIDSEEIQGVIDDETKLPATYRHGLGHRGDDVAIGPDEGPVKVWGPENPEDHYD